MRSSIYYDQIQLEWTGAGDHGTQDYRSYERRHRLIIPDKNILELSSDPHFRGDGTKLNPEELLIASVSSCHMLWYLHLCADAGIVVKEYSDFPKGRLSLKDDGSGVLDDIELNIHIALTPESDRELALTLHSRANQMCFIANALKFKVRHLVTIGESAR